MNTVDQIDQGLSEAKRDQVWADQDAAVLAKKEKNGVDINVTTSSDDMRHIRDPTYPSPDQKRTLRRVPGSVNILIFSVGLIEFAERFSYYGCSNVFTNFIQQPLPPGSSTGALTGPNQTPGFLGQGQRTAFSLTTLNSFWIYVTPIAGAIIADMRWGRFKTICWAILIAQIGHILLIVSALPVILRNSGTAASLAIFCVAIIVGGLGTGSFKSNVSPLIADQMPARDLTLKTLKKGEVVIEDPALTTQRVFLYFYMLINLGSLSGQIGMVFGEQDIGFWFAYTIPTIVLFLAPLVLVYGKNRYHKVPPSGSVFLDAIKVIRFALSKAKSSNPVTFFRNAQSSAFWDNVKPSTLERNGEPKPAWMAHRIDDLWIAQLRRGLKACQVFILIPFFWLCYNQMTGNLTSQAATMTRNGAPNDLINNLNPISLVILIPLVDQFLYPYLRKKRINFTPIKRIALGFQIAALSMVVAAIIQHYVYATSPCGKNAATCDEFSPLNVWIQTPAYVLIGMSEIFTSITGLEYAYTKSPENMRSFVTSIWLLQNAFAAAIGQAFTALSNDPLLVVNYGACAGLSCVAGIVFWLWFRNLDKEEVALNDMRRYEGVDSPLGAIGGEKIQA